MSTSSLSNALRAIIGAMQAPVIAILLLLIIITILLFGTLIAEIFTERRHLKAKLPQLADEIREGRKPLKKVIETSGLLKRQKNALRELISHPELTPVMRESVAVRLIEEERSYYARILMVTDLIARIAPMFGLLGTLIPLGPGIIALGQGDTYTLSTSLLTAFDTTAVGLLTAALALLISAIRRRWYKNYMSALEMAMECMLEVLAEKQNGTQHETLSETPDEMLNETQHESLRETQEEEAEPCED